MPSSPIVSLQVEAAHWPIKTRLEYLTDRLLIRWRSRPHHPAYERLSTLQRQGVPVTAFRKRPPLLLQRLLLLPPQQVQAPPPGQQRPCYTLSHHWWMTDLPVFPFFPPAPVTEANINSPDGIYLALIKSLWWERYVIATDGSRVEDQDGTAQVGAAAYDATTRYTGLYRLPPLTTVYLAEAYAVLRALQYARAADVQRPLVITDSQSVIRALQSHAPLATTPQLIVDIRRLLITMIREGRSPEISWVPAHKEIGPNEAADAAANIAREVGDDILLPLPATV